MANLPAGKNLRLALIQGAKITEDRTLKRRVAVTVGQDARNTFVVPVSNLPSSFTIFELVNNVYSLVFTAQMEGKVHVNGVDMTLQQAVQQGLAKARGSSFVLPLNDQSKGRVSLGEVSLLFQFVTPPPEPPRPELPANVKGNFLAQMDQLFLLVLAVSLTIHFSGATFIACQPMPEERELSLDELPDRFVKAMMPVEVKKPDKPTEVATAPKDDKKKDEGKDKGEKKATSNKAELTKAVASKGLLKVIGADSGGSGAFEDVLGSSSGVGSIGDALSGASGVGVATADSLAGGPHGGGTGKAAGIGDLGTSGGGKVDLADTGARQIRGQVRDAAPEVESKDVDREALTRYVRSRTRAIQACYEKELKRNPSLKGKIVIRFSIMPNGRTGEIDIEENSLGNEAVASCIRTIVRSWNFPFKPDSEVPVSYPFLFTPAS